MNHEDRLQRMIQAARETTSGSAHDWDRFAARAHRALFMRRAVASGLVALVAVAVVSGAVLLGAAPDDPSPAPAAQPTPTTSTPTPADPTPDPSPTEPDSARVPEQVAPFDGELWFVADERLSFGWTPLPRTDEPGAVSSRFEPGSSLQRVAAALEALLAGPAPSDVEAGATTAIPDGTELRDVRAEDGVAIVDVGKRFETGGGSLSMQLRVAQVVFTATQVDGIESVRIALDGEVVESIGGEGVLVDKPMTRADFQDVSPAIVLVTPKIGSTVSSPVAVQGFANVFEANVSIRILDANGEPVVETFTTATCGSGCWGDFNEKVTFSVAREQEGILEVLSYSAEDGSPTDVISIPVTLSP